MGYGQKITLSLLLTGLLLVTFLVPARAETYTVGSTEYTRTTTLSDSDSWDEYELTANNGQHVKYSMTVLSSGKCAKLYLAKGHNIGMSFDYYVSYSKDSCVGSYSNDFPVGSNDGTRFTILLTSDSTGDVQYKIDISVYSPAIPDWLLGLLVVIVIVVLIAVIRTVISRRRQRSMQPPQPPLTPPTQPPSPPQ